MSGTSFTAGRDNKGAFATGKGAMATTTITEIVEPDPSIDILAALAALRDIVAHTPGIELKALTRIDEAQEEAAKPEPKREEVKDLITQATQYVRGAAEVSDAVERLKPHLMQVSAWVGSAWRTWAPTLGLG